MSFQRRSASRPMIGTAALVCLIAFLVALASEHVLEPSLDPLRHEVSEYVHTSTGAVMTVGFLRVGRLAGRNRTFGPTRVASDVACTPVRRCLAWDGRGGLFSNPDECRGTSAGDDANDNWAITRPGLRLNKSCPARRRRCFGPQDPSAAGISPGRGGSHRLCPRK